MKNLVVICIVFVLISFASTAQNKSLGLLITGKVVQNETMKSLSEVHITISESSYGTITNSNGDFKLLIPKSLKNNTLIFSHIGHDNLKIAIDQAENIRQFLMSESSEELEEIELSNISARRVVQNAISKIPQNYYSKPHKSNGFYRLTSKTERQYIHLSEAVFSIVHELGKNSKHNFNLNKMRAFQDEVASKGIDLGLSAKSLFRLDIVNEKAEINLLTRKGLKMHDFEYGPSKMYEGKEVYTIRFDQKSELKKSGYKGEMFIDKESLAFLHFNLKLSPVGVQYRKFGSAGERAMLKISGINIVMSENAYQVSYKKIGNTYYLYNVGNDAILNIKSKKDHYNFEVQTRVDFLVTSIEMRSIQDEENALSIGNNRLIENVKSSYDQQFWDDYTIILPNLDFEAIANRIEANNKANEDSLPK